MKRLEAYYNEIKKLKERYQAEKADDDIAAEIRKEYQEIADRINAEGETFGKVYEMYESMKGRRNEYIDIDELNDNRRIPGLVRELRECGIQFFTFSSGWSSTNEAAWELTKNGCTLLGIMEINGRCQKFMSDEYEKTHGFLFRAF